MTYFTFFFKTLFKAALVLLTFNSLFIAEKVLDFATAQRSKQSAAQVVTQVDEPATPGQGQSDAIGMKDEGDYWTVQIKKPRDITELHSLGSNLINTIR